MKNVRVILVLSLCILFIIHLNLFAQLGNKNMYLLRNLNQHFTLTLYSAVWGYKAPNGREYAILGCPAGTSFVDITDLTNIHEVGFLTGPNSSWREMKTYSNYAYIVSEASNSGVQIVDLQYLPDSIHYVRKFLFTGYGNTHTISQEGHYLYLNGGNYQNGGTFVLDILDPENPVKKGQWETKYVHDCRVKGDTIFACNIYANDGGTVTVIDARNKDSLRTISAWANNPNPGPHNCALTTERNYCLVTDEINGTPRLLKIWDIQDLTNVIRVATWQPTGITTSIVHNVEINGNYALAAHYTAGVRFIDITNPTTPTEVAWYDTYPSNNNTGYNGCWGVYMFPSGKIVASDRQTGLYVLKTTFNINVSIEGFYNELTNSLNMSDTVRAYLRSITAPFDIIDSSIAVLDSLTLTGNFKFNVAPLGNYYIVLKHRNSIETWSKVGGESYNPMTLMAYDFTSIDTQAYGNNLILKGIKYCIYSGDVDQNGIIDLTDINLIYNDLNNSIEGYVNTDLTGDGVVDISDLSISYNNSNNSIIKLTPKL